MAHTPDDQAFLSQLQAEHPEQAALIHCFARQNGLPVPDTCTSPAVRHTVNGTAMPDNPPLPHSGTDPSADACWRVRRPPIDPGRCPQPDSTQHTSPPGAAQFQTRAPLQGDELIAAVVARRRALGLNQAAFATRLGISLRTLQEWEQGRRRPSGPAEAMLRWQL